MSDTYTDKNREDIEQEKTSAENLQVENEAEENIQHHHSRHEHKNHSGKHHRGSRHYHKSSNYGGKSRKYRESSGSELERIGRSVIYESAKKDKINMFVKRSFFCIIALLFISFVFTSIINPDFFDEFTNIGERNDEKEINELKIKIIQYEDKIEELEKIIEKYENSELPE